MEELIQQWEVIQSQGGLLKRFAAGEQVRVISGHLETLAKVLEEAKSPNGKAPVLMEFMGLHLPGVNRFSRSIKNARYWDTNAV